jgi:hypothetical protein
MNIRRTYSYAPVEEHQKTWGDRQTLQGLGTSKLEASHIQHLHATRISHNIVASRLAASCYNSVLRLLYTITAADMPIKFPKEVSSHLFKYVSKIDIKFNREYTYTHAMCCEL